MAATAAERIPKFMATHFPPLTPDRSLKRGRTEANFKIFVQSKETFPRFNVIHSDMSGKPVRKLSPFLVTKCLGETLGPGHKVTKITSGDLLIEVRDTIQYEKLSNLKTFGDIPITVTAHRSMNTVRGVVSEDDLLELTDAVLLAGWKDENVINVQRIRIKRDNKEIPTKHIVLTFGSSILPETLVTGYTKIRVRPYIPNPRRCFNCQRYGHGSQTCRGQLTCPKCGSKDHSSENCENALHCVNCDGGHAAYSRSCPSWKTEKDIIALKVKENISFGEARKRMSFLKGTRYADAARKGAAPQQPQAPLRPTHSEPAVVPSVPLAAVGKSTPPLSKQGPSTSGLSGQGASPRVARPLARSQSLHRRASSASSEAMDTAQCSSALSASKEQRGSLDRSRKGKAVRVTAPGKAS